MAEPTVYSQLAQGYGIAQADRGGTAIVNITGLTPEHVLEMMNAGAQQARIDDLSRQLETTSEAVHGFLKILRREQVPLEKLPQTLADIAQRHRDLLQRLSALDPEDLVAKANIEEARAILAHADSTNAYDRADALLAEAEVCDVRGIREAEALEIEAQQVVKRKRRSAAATRAERGELSSTRLDDFQAAQHFKAASDLVVGDTIELRMDYLNRYLVALLTHTIAREDGSAILAEAIQSFRETLNQCPRDRVPLQWAATEFYLAVMLELLAQREGGTARLEEAVAAYREALKEWPRERVPERWAETQRGLARTLAELGERESGTARLEEAVATYREALKEWTREHVPQKWAAVEFDLGIALLRLGERESGTARLEESVAAFREALKEYMPERNPVPWYMAQYDLGIALLRLGERESGTARLEEALRALESTLGTREAHLLGREADLKTILESLRQLIAQRSSQYEKSA